MAPKKVQLRAVVTKMVVVTRWAPKMVEKMAAVTRLVQPKVKQRVVLTKKVLPMAVETG